MKQVDSGEHMGISYEIWEVPEKGGHTFWGELFIAGEAQTARQCNSLEDAQKWVYNTIVIEVEG